MRVVFFCGARLLVAAPARGESGSHGHSASGEFIDGME